MYFRHRYASQLAFLVSPKFDDFDNTKQIRFFARDDNSVNIIVGTMSDPTNAATFTPYDTIFHNFMTNDVWEEQTVSFNNYNGTDKHIAITTWYPDNNYKYLYIDNFVYEDIPQCPTPVNPFESNLTDSTVVLNFTEQSTSTEWIISYLTENKSAFNGDTIRASNEPFKLTGLTPETRYYWYVQAVCSLGGKSQWSEQDIFTTLISNDSCINALPIACGETKTGSTSLATDNDKPADCSITNGDHGVWYSFTGVGDSVFVSLCNSSYNTQLSAYYGNCNNLHCVGGSNDDCGNNARLGFVAANGVQYYLHVSGDGSAKGNYELSMTCHDVNICRRPKNLTMGYTKADSASISWITGDSAQTGYILTIGPDGFDPLVTNGSKIAITHEDTTLWNLNEETTYTVYLQEVCENGDTSLYTAGLDFSTKKRFVHNSISPSHQAIGIAANSNIVIGFNDKVKASSIENGIRIRGSQSGPISGTFSGGGTNEITFSPTNNYLVGERISVVLTPQLSSEDGEHLRNKKTFYFNATNKKRKIFGASFSEHKIDSVTDKTYVLESIDIDQDGDVDFITGQDIYNGSSVFLHLNDGTGSFSVSKIDSGKHQVRGIRAADMDNDGDIDIVIANLFKHVGFSAHNIRLFSNNGSEVFTESALPNPGVVGRVQHIDIGDIDNDGDIDLVACNNSNKRLELYRNNGDGTFVSDTITTQYTDPFRVKLFDVDMDNNLDVIVSSLNGNKETALLINKGDSTYTHQTLYSNEVCYAIEAGDLDGDSDIDLALGFSSTANTTMLKNNGNQSFTSISLGITEYDVSLKITDVNGDGKQNICTGQNAGYWTYDNNEFDYQLVANFGGQVYGFDVQDVNNDGASDFVVANYSNDKLSWYEMKRAVRNTSGNYKKSSSCPIINGNDWVHLKDDQDELVMSINPNGNNLGEVCWGVRKLNRDTAFFIGADIDSALLMKRRFYIDAQNSSGLNINGGVSIKFHLKGEEYRSIYTRARSKGRGGENFDKFVQDSLKIHKHHSGTDNFWLGDNSGVNYSVHSISEIDHLGDNDSSIVINGLTTLSEFMFGYLPDNPQTALPVDFIFFTAKWVNIGQTAQLVWQTAIEENNSHFEVERSFDGINYETIGRVEGAGSTFETTDYQFLDQLETRNTKLMSRDIQGETIYYRLKQVDYNGNYEYSRIESLAINNNEESSISVFPNPATNKIQLVNNSTNEIELIEIYNSQGLLVGRYHTKTIDVSNLKPGVYLIQTINEQKVSKTQFVIQR
jgi:hypothetical protein